MEQRTFVVATDGSSFARCAFMQIWHSILSPDDRIVILHLFNNEKQATLSFDLKKDYIYADYERELLSTVTHKQRINSKYALVFEPKVPHVKIREQIQAQAIQLGANFLVIGFSGIKSAGLNSTLMSSAIDYNVKFGSLPIFAIKRQLQRKDMGGFTWAVLVDGSDSCIKTLTSTMSIIDRARDRLVLLHGYNLEYGNYRDMYLAVLQEHGVTGKYEEIECGVSIAESLVEYLNNWENRCDFVSVGTSGIDLETGLFKTGAITLQVLAYAKANVFISR